MFFWLLCGLFAVLFICIDCPCFCCKLCKYMNALLFQINPFSFLPFTPTLPPPVSVETRS